MSNKNDLKGEWNYQGKRYILSYNKNIPREKEDILLTPEELIEEITTHDRKILLSIKEGNVKKDYLNLLSSVKKNLERGEIVGTKEALIRKFKKRDYHLENLRKTRYNILDNSYMAVVEASQALLLINGAQIISPRNLIEALKKKGKRKVSIKKAKKVITVFKDYEHGKIKLPSGKELDKIIRYAKEYYTEVKSLI